MNEWQPIETAPKDGTAVLVWCSLAYGPIESIAIAGYSSFINGWQEVYDREGLNTSPCVPTHWMPLPPPPKEDKR